MSDKKLLSREEERGQITESCELCVWGGGHRGTVAQALSLFYAAGILFHLKIGEQVLKVTCGLLVSE